MRRVLATGSDWRTRQRSVPSQLYAAISYQLARESEHCRTGHFKTRCSRRSAPLIKHKVPASIVPFTTFIARLIDRNFNSPHGASAACRRRVFGCFAPVARRYRRVYRLCVRDQVIFGVPVRRRGGGSGSNSERNGSRVPQWISCFLIVAAAANRLREASPCHRTLADFSLSDIFPRSQ